MTRSFFPQKGLKIAGADDLTVQFMNSVQLDHRITTQKIRVKILL
jgi:hypothetical protein